MTEQESDLVEIYRTQDRESMDLAKGFLDAQGIPNFIRSDVMRAWRSIRVGPMAEDRLVVLAAHAARATAALVAAGFLPKP